MLIVSMAGYSTINSSYAFSDPIFSVEKTVDIDKKRLVATFMDVEKYSYIFPEIIQSSELIGNDNNNLAKMNIAIHGILISTDVKYSLSTEAFKIEVISGGLKGTKVIIKLADVIDSNDKSHDNTIMHTELTLELPWYLLFLTLVVSDVDDITSMLDMGIDRVVHHAKYVQT